MAPPSWAKEHVHNRRLSESGGNFFNDDSEETKVHMPPPPNELPLAHPFPPFLNHFTWSCFKVHGSCLNMRENTKKVVYLFKEKQ